MKKVSNNLGVTLIEVVVATLILSIIAIPIFNTMYQTFKINVDSNAEIKMNAAIERIIEETIADGTHTKLMYYDKSFNVVPQADRYYKIEVSKSTNQFKDMSSLDEYDRWDFDLTLHADGTVSLYKNSNVKDANGKLYIRTPEFANENIISNPFFIDFIGERTLNGPYACKYGSSPLGEVSFTPGTGKISSLNDNTIVLNVINEGITTSFNLSVFNDTYYNNYDTVFNLVGGELTYHKHVIVNVFNDINSKVNITPSSNYVDVNQRNELTPHIENGDKIIITVTDINNKTIKTVETVVPKSVTIS